MARQTWVVPETKLDPEQRLALKAIINSDENFWIQGFAGSGKSILLVHAMRNLVQREPRLNTEFVVYTRSLVNLFEAGVGAEFESVPVQTMCQFRRDSRWHDVLFADEVQDFNLRDLKKLRSECSRVILAGDKEQSIYDNTVLPEEIEAELKPRIVSLAIIHRLTRTIYDIAREFGEIVQPKNPINLDVEVPLWKAENREQEIIFVWTHSHVTAQAGHSVAVLLPSRQKIIELCNAVLEHNGCSKWEEVRGDWNREDFDSLNKHLLSQGVALQIVGSGAGDLYDPQDGNVRIMTYHSAKGLDFNTVFLPFLDSSTSIFRDENIARKLFFVAVTRSRQNLHLSYSNDYGAHPFVESIRDRLKPLDCPRDKKMDAEDDFQDEEEEILF